MGDRVREVKWESDTKVEALFTENLGDTPLQAGCFVLCSGRFFTRGLKSDMEKVYEPVFGCDVEFEPDRSKWCVDDFFAAQPFESFGVKTSEEGNALKEGKILCIPVPSRPVRTNCVTA